MGLFAFYKCKTDWSLITCSARFPWVELDPTGKKRKRKGIDSFLPLSAFHYLAFITLSHRLWKQADESMRHRYDCAKLCNLCRPQCPHSSVQTIKVLPCRTLIRTKWHNSCENLDALFAICKDEGLILLLNITAVPWIDEYKIRFQTTHQILVTVTHVIFQFSF